MRHYVSSADDQPETEAVSLTGAKDDVDAALTVALAG